jgi:hypothetical protein
MAAVVKMGVVVWVCTPCSVVPYVPSVSMRTTLDTEDGGSTSIQSVRTRKETLHNVEPQKTTVTLQINLHV